ncbi:hypothetical protein [Ekhidna sp.]|uniref:hypothetical protein n=1 Tax=Ekhidna sp. TaxID=2608089 RepID=UPI0032EEE941
MKKIKSVRKWLNKNKVFFEVFSFLFLGLAAIFISYQQWKIASMELQLNELNYLPKINIELEKNGNTESIIISNKGFHLKDYSSDLFSFYSLPKDCNENCPYDDCDEEYGGQVGGGSTQYINVRVIDYYIDQRVTNNSINTLEKYQGYPFNAQIRDSLENEMREIHCGFNFKILVKVEYSTEFNVKSTQFFEINEFGLTEIEKSLYERTTSDALAQVYFPKISANEVIDRSGIKSK